MSLPVYRDVEGEIRRFNEWDTHHPFNVASMHGRGEREWANLFRIAMFKEWHNQGKRCLHANAPHLPKPGRDLAYMLRAFRYEQMAEAEITPISPYDQMVELNDYIHDLAETSENRGIQKQATRIANALELQMPYILGGQVEVIRYEENMSDV